MTNCGIAEPVELALRVSPAGRATPLRTEKLSDRTRCFEAAASRWEFPIMQRESIVTGTWAHLPARPVGPPHPAGLTQQQLDAVFAAMRPALGSCFTNTSGPPEDPLLPVTVDLQIAASGVVLSAVTRADARVTARCVALNARTLRFPAGREGTLTSVTWAFRHDGGEAPANALVVTKKDVLTKGGLEKADLSVIIKAHEEEIRFCYERELQDQPTLAGKLVVHGLVGADGSVIDAAVDHDELGDPAVGRCVVGRVKRWVFGAPVGGGAVKVTFPWIFKSVEE